METNSTTQPATDDGTKTSAQISPQNEASELDQNVPQARTSGSEVETIMNAAQELISPEKGEGDHTTDGHDGNGDGTPPPTTATTPKTASAPPQRKTSPPKSRGKKKTSVEAKGQTKPTATTKAETKAPAAPTPPAKPAVPAKPDTRPTATFFLHGDAEHSKWKPGMWQYDLAAVIAKRHNSDLSRPDARAMDPQYQRVVLIRGAKTNLAMAEKEYRAVYQVIRDEADRTHKILMKAKPEDLKARNTDVPAWGPYINTWAAGAVEQYASMVGVTFTPPRAPKDTHTEDYQAGKDFAKGYFKQGKAPAGSAPKSTEKELVTV